MEKEKKESERKKVDKKKQRYKYKRHHDSSCYHLLPLHCPLLIWHKCKAILTSLHHLCPICGAVRVQAPFSPSFAQLLSARVVMAVAVVVVQIGSMCVCMCVSASMSTSECGKIERRDTRKSLEGESA